MLVPSVWALFWFKTQETSAGHHWQSPPGLVTAPCGQSLGLSSCVPGPRSAPDPRAGPCPPGHPRGFLTLLPPLSPRPAPRVRRPLPTQTREAGSHQMRRRGPALKRKRPGSWRPPGPKTERPRSQSAPGGPGGRRRKRLPICSRLSSCDASGHLGGSAMPQALLPGRVPLCPHSSRCRRLRPGLGGPLAVPRQVLTPCAGGAGWCRPPQGTLPPALPGTLQGSRGLEQSYNKEKQGDLHVKRLPRRRWWHRTACQCGDERDTCLILGSRILWRRARLKTLGRTDQCLTRFYSLLDTFIKPYTL